ncbi:MAG: sulfite exporter TauE/SafE family protein [Proteobacteria bacterium]|nr:sulfite exporter TauE/SafE family protein [Pseudomonadota bacterium]
MIISSIILCAGGLISGLLSGLLGIGGGLIMVPLLIALGEPYPTAVATSSLAIVIISCSGTLKNLWNQDVILRDIVLMGIPGIITAYVGASFVRFLPRSSLELAFSVLLAVTIFLNRIRIRLAESTKDTQPATHQIIPLCSTGGAGGLLAGLFGVGGGVIMVPMQLALLRTTIKPAVRNSLGVIAISSISASIKHGMNQGILYSDGVLLGIGGLLGAQVSLHFLPKLPDSLVQRLFDILLFVLALYFLGLFARDFPK